MGFCKARIISDADEPDGTDTSCEIYHLRVCPYGNVSGYILMQATATSLSPDSQRIATVVYVPLVPGCDAAWQDRLAFDC